MRLISPDSRLGTVILHACGGLISLGLVAAAVGGNWAIASWRTDVEREQSQAEALLRCTTEICAAQRLSQSRLEIARNQAEMLLASVPESPNDTRLLQQVSDLARKSAIELSGFHPGSLADFRSHREMEVRLHGEGSYEGICRFLAGLAQLGRMYRVTQLDLTGPASRGGTCRMDLELRLAFGLKHTNKTVGATP